MRILFLAPVPPPIQGHALAAKIFLDSLSLKYEVTLVDLNKNSLESGNLTWTRIREVFGILYKVWKNRNVDIVYLTISESFFGNIKDLIIYFICRKSLSRTFIHIHGGS